MKFNKNLTITEACKKTYNLANAEDRDKLTFLHDRIKEGYMQSWVIDNITVTWCYHMTDSDTEYCSTQFPIGCYVDTDGNRQDFCYMFVSATP